jgi:hypothetical protein
VDGSSGPPVQPHDVERHRPGQHPVQDTHGTQRLERVALNRDAMAHTEPLRRDLGELHLDAPLGERETQHASGDAAADDEHLLYGHGRSLRT